MIIGKRKMWLPLAQLPVCECAQHLHAALAKACHLWFCLVYLLRKHPSKVLAILSFRSASAITFYRESLSESSSLKVIKQNHSKILNSLNTFPEEN